MRRSAVAFVALVVGLIAFWRPWKAYRNSPTAQAAPTLRTWDGAIATPPQVTTTPSRATTPPSQATPTPPQATTTPPEPIGTTPQPTTDSAKIAAVLAFAGPTIPVANVPAQFKFYEDSFRVESAAQWAAFGPAWGAGNSISGYERAAIYYVWWARTGDTVYKSRAHATAVDYRDKYLIPAQYGASPHWSQMESMYLDCIITNDRKSCDSVGNVATRFSAFIRGYLTNVGNPDLDQRIQARVIMSLWMAEKLAGRKSVFSAWLDSAIVQSLSTLNANGYANLTQTCGGSLNYMGGMLYDVLTRIHDQRPGPYNAAIETKAKAFGNFLWPTQWRATADPADKSFNYLSLVCATPFPGSPNGAGSPTSAPDLNGLILPLFGWLGKTTGDPTWFTRGDQVLAGMQNSSVYLYRQFSESYSSSFRYFGYRWPVNATLRAPAPK